QQRERPRAVAAKQKIRAAPDLGDFQPIDKHRLDEKLWLPPRQFRRELHDRDALQTRPLESLELLLERHQQLRRLRGAKDSRRMRLKGNPHGRTAALAGSAANALEQLHVAAMQAVEIPERGNGRCPLRPRRVWKRDDLHAAQWTSSSSPS